MPTNKMKAYRHGEIAFVKIKKLPENLPKPSRRKYFLKGSHGHPHKFDNGEFYLKNEDVFIFGYFIAKDTTLYHAKHGNGDGELKTAKLPDGYYQLRRQVEFVNKQMKQVID